MKNIVATFFGLKMAREVIWGKSFSLRRNQDPDWGSLGSHFRLINRVTKFSPKRSILKFLTAFCTPKEPNLAKILYFNVKNPQNGHKNCDYE